MEAFDVIVAGGGPAGLSAALMLGRCRRRVLVCDRGEPRNRRSTALHGYLTRDGIPPAEFNALGRTEVARYGVVQRDVGVADAVRVDDGFRIVLTDGNSAHARYLLLATGVVDELPRVPGIDECYGRSVFHCPYCDGWEWRDRRLAALGNGQRAARLALSLLTWSRRVLVCLDGGRIERSMQDRLRRNGVSLQRERVAALQQRSGRLEQIVFASGETVACDALFFATGQHAHDALAARLGCAFTRRGTVQTGGLSETNVPRLFVAGDASRDVQFVAVAAAEGAKAAVAINQALQRETLHR
jgi:thioredoxin reductase